MAGGPMARLLPDGHRLHLNHGPIDLVIGAEGAAGEVAASYERAVACFAELLSRLVEELAMLRRPVAAPRWRPAGPVARRMVDAAWPHRGIFVTPMAAVAGAVADEICAALAAGGDLRTAYVNNSGDIAFYLAPGASLKLGLVADLDRPGLNAIAALNHGMDVRGVATSGWKGRSHSLGIADSVTVLARGAAVADVAATLIANAVTVDHPAIERRPARDLDDTSDLEDRLVTVAVGDLGPVAVDSALANGVAVADAMVRAGQLAAAVLVLNDQVRAVGMPLAAIAA